MPAARLRARSGHLRHVPANDVLNNRAFPDILNMQGKDLRICGKKSIISVFNGVEGRKP
jgi:hypothetical protein